MADIALTWNPATAQCDWTMGVGDLVTGNDLETAVLLSYFTDRVATVDFQLPAGETNPRGWWADAYNQDAIGSNLWQLERAVKNSETLNTAITFARQALQWMIDDGVAAQIDVIGAWEGADGSTLALATTITEPSGKVSKFQHAWAWGGF